MEGLTLITNPCAECWVVPIRYTAVTELYLKFTQLSEAVKPLRVSSSLIIISSFKIRCIETRYRLMLMLALAIIRSLMRPLIGMLFVTLAHTGEYSDADV